jgi:hypothetical protein
MIRTTKSIGGTLPMDEATFQAMRPKENSDQRKSRLRREAREAKQLAAGCAAKSDPQASALDKQARQAAPNHGIIIDHDALNRAWITEGMQSAPCEQNPKSEMRSHLE